MWTGGLPVIGYLHLSIDFCQSFLAHTPTRRGKSTEDKKRPVDLNRPQDNHDKQKKSTLSDEPFYVVLRTIATTRKSSNGWHEETSISWISPPSIIKILNLHFSTVKRNFFPSATKSQGEGCSPTADFSDKRRKGHPEKGTRRRQSVDWDRGSE